METDNIFAIYDEKQREKLKEEAAQRAEWGMDQRKRLVDLIEKTGEIITDHVWDLLLFNVNGLRINNDKVYYISFYKESKKLTSLFARYNKLIIEHFSEIVKGERWKQLI